MSDSNNGAGSGVEGDVAPLIPSHVAELAASCVRFVYAALQFELDFSDETLSILDHYLGSARAEIEKRPEAAPLLAQAMGAYMGQILVNEFGAHWRAPTVDSNEWRVWFSDVMLAINPVGAAYNILYQGVKHPGPSAELLVAPEHREPLQERLGTLEVPERDYYLFSTRFDAIHIAYEAIRADQKLAGDEDAVFEWADYEDAGLA